MTPSINQREHKRGAVESTCSSSRWLRLRRKSLFQTSSSFSIDISHNIITTTLIVLLSLVYLNDYYLIPSPLTLTQQSLSVVEALVFNNSPPSKTKRNIVKRVTAGPLQISELGCGTWSWGNRLLFDYNPKQDVEIYEAYKIVRDAGVTLFDTADSYGTLDLNGRAEILLGQFERQYLAEQENEGSIGKNIPTKNLPFLNDFLLSGQTKSDYSQQVATKLAPYPWRITRENIVKATKGSLRRLKQDQITLAQAHWSTSKYQPFQERAIWDGLVDVYNLNLCQAVGVSNYGPKQLLKVFDYFKQENVPLATAQVQFSLLTYKDPISRDMIDVCDDIGCRLISYSPLCLGLLTGKYDLDNLPTPRNNPRRQLFKELLPGAQSLLKLLEVISKDYNKSQSQIAINWALCKGGVPIPGARTPQQAIDNINSVGWKLKQDAIDELDKAALSINKPMIQNIFQTT